MNRTARRGLAVIAIALLLGGTFVGTVRAQGTPEPGGTLTPYSFSTPFAPTPDQCTTEAASTDAVSSLLATPVAEVTPELTVEGIVALPPGVPLTPDAASDINSVLTQLWACNNARNKAAILTLLTDQAIQQSFGNTSNTAFDMADLRADVAAALTPGEPRSNDELARIDAVISYLQQDNGEIGVLVLNTDPSVADGDQVLDYFAFTSAADSGAVKVSNIILDPFDLTPGYGFEKAA